MAEDGGAEAAPKSKSRMLLFAAPVALLLGGASFYAVYAGLVALPFLDPPAQETTAEAAAEEPFGPEGSSPAETAAYVALDPLVITLGERAGSRHLKLTVQVETSAEGRDGVAAVKPRIADVLNTFLRAVDESDVAEPRAMIRLRAQMLRRVRLVTPPGAVRDLLIQEFVLN